MDSPIITLLLSVNLILTLWVAVHLRHRIKKLEAGVRKKAPKPTNLSPANVPVPEPCEQRTLSFQNGQCLILQVPKKRPASPPIFIMGPPKSGTVLFNSMMEQLAPHVGFPVLDLPGQVFKSGLPLGELADSDGIFDLDGICFTGFRTTKVGTKPIKLRTGAKAAVILRDPRDILVSLYFSEGKSHTVPESGPLRETLIQRRESMAGAEINDWILKRALGNVGSIRVWADWIAAQPRDSVKVFRYEDIIFNKAKWMKSLMNWLGWKIDPAFLAEVIEDHDIRPESEDSSKHIRRVAPGDHKDKLKPETIAELNRIYGPSARAWGYDLEAAA